ncbi:unnamed protein product [Lactuca saligna]|uniref:SWIM-type domain-containing protein n=1 Tax=Lactuca saligna TaxID=75948 RepID=A0AA35YTR2_LACSI|nr:unnamed protein product [Lactuca saligna]
MRSNPGSTVRIYVNINPDQTTTFHRIYVCFKAIKDGWKIGCRRVIGLDAWAVVEVENKVNWTWFLELVSEDLSLDAGRGLCVISDQHKGLVEATKDILPHVEHRQCVRHIYANFRKVYSGIQFRNMFWATEKSTTEGDFKINMDRIKTLSEGAYDHLMAREPHTWCRAFFGSGLACESVENGITECFNAVIVDARKKPLLAMLEEIRLYMMERFYNLREEAHKLEGDVCEATLLKMEEFAEDIRTWYAVPSGVNSYEIRNGFQSYGVDSEHHYCSCRLWDIAGIPCVHAQVAILYTNQDPKEFISTWFNKSNYMATYQSNILPINGSNLWEETGYTKPLPPTARRMPGRPNVKRRRHVSEHEDKYPQVSNKGRTVQCKNYLQRGHNKASCKNPKVVPEPKPKKKIGRPKLDPDLTNWIGSRRGDRGGGTGYGRRGKRGGGRGSGGRGKRGSGNTKFGEVTSNLDEENVVTPTVESDNEEAKDMESLEVDDEIRVDVKSDIDFMRQSNYTTQEILECLGINEEELYEFEGLKHVPVDLNISQGFEFPSQLTVETLTENEEEGMDEEGMEQEGMNQDGMGPEGIIEEDMGREQEGMDQEGMNQDGMGAQGLDQEGINENGIGEVGMEQEVMDQEGMNQDGMGAQGLDQEGINENDIGEEDMEQEVMDKEGMNQDGMGAQGLDQEGINENGIGEEGMEQEGIDQEGLVVEDMGRRPKLRKRKTSERITKIQLKKLVVVKHGKGMSSSNPLSLD